MAPNFIEHDDLQVIENQEEQLEDGKWLDIWVMSK
jgi:hypothetical protein